MQVPSGFRAVKRSRAACPSSTFSAPSGRGRCGPTRLGASMFDLRSRAGIAGVATGAALLALPVVPAGQVPVVDQVVGGVTQTAESLTPAPVPPVKLPVPAVQPAPPASVPAAPAPAGPGAAAPAPSAQAPAPREVPSTGAPSIGADSDATRSSKDRTSDAKASRGHRGGATAGAASGEGASAAQAESVAEQNAGASGADDGVTDVEIAATDSGDEGGPAALPFTGLQLALLAMAGLATLVGGALLRRAT